MQNSCWNNSGFYSWKNLAIQIIITFTFFIICWDFFIRYTFIYTLTFDGRSVVECLVSELHQDQSVFQSNVFS